MRHLLSSFIIIIFFIILSDCSSTAQKEIIVSAGCQNLEVSNDLNYHLKNLEDFFNENNIKQSFINNDSCFIILKMNNHEKKYDYVMTDVDIMKECKNFFKIKD